MGRAATTCSSPKCRCAEQRGQPVAPGGPGRTPPGPSPFVPGPQVAGQRFCWHYSRRWPTSGGVPLGGDQMVWSRSAASALVVVALAWATGAAQGLRPQFGVGMRVDASYSANSANEQLKGDLTSAVGQPSDEKTTLLGASLNVTYPASLAARVKPFVIGGIGLYHTTISTTIGTSTTQESATKLAWNLGGGVVYSVGGVVLFLEARYVNVAAVSGFPRVTCLPLTAGVRFGGR